MIVDELLLALARHWLVVVAVGALTSCFLIRHQKGLSKYPGPLLASITDLWQVFEVTKDFQTSPWVRWHDAYGDVVRIAPNKLSFADPSVIPDILGPGKDFRKSGFYFVAATTAHGVPSPSLFSTLDKPYHDRIKRAVSSAFSVTSLVSYEPYVDRVIETWVEKIGRRFADTGEVCNLARWLHYYSLDVIGEVVYGQPYGFVARGEDVNHMIRDTTNFLDYVYWAGQAPWLDKLFMKNPIKLFLARRARTKASVGPAVVTALKQQQARGLDLDTNASPAPDETGKGHDDLLNQFMKAKHEHPELLSNREILMLGISMVFAGSDTTAWSLSAFFYYVLRTPGVYQRLTEEIQERTNSKTVPYTTAKDLPFLDACIKETFRMHPAARFASERIVPSEGADIGGQHIPGGTVVAVNAWAIHRRKEIWGDDVESFRPERWLEDKSSSKRMNSSLFQFGAGNFVCLGRNISLLEMYKVTATALQAFDFDLVDKDQTWRLSPGSFARMESVNVRVRRR